MTNNTVPRTHAPLIQLAVKAALGAQTFGPAIELEHNTGPRITTDLYDLTGDPSTPLIPGKQGELNAAKETLKTARQTARAAKSAGKEFCRQGIALLKPTLGNIYNSEWETAGFLARSLAAPKEPVPMLLQFRQYFERFPAKENASLNLTAAQAQAKLVAIQAAELAASTAEADYVDAKKLRDGSQRRLFERMSDLRSELEQLIDPDDGRWYEFGFNRPVDGVMPVPVTGVIVTPLAPGTVSLAWDLSTRALNYRVVWRIAGGSAPENEIGLFSDRKCTITGLPSATSVVIGVSARNGAGETAPTEVTLTAP